VTKFVSVPTLQRPGVAAVITPESDPLYTGEHTPFVGTWIFAGSRSSPGRVDPFGAFVVTIARFLIVPVAHGATFTGIVIRAYVDPLVIAVALVHVIVAVPTQYHPVPAGVPLRTIPAGSVSVTVVSPVALAGPLFFTTIR
jgi:hypothetical protein